MLPSQNWKEKNGSINEFHGNKNVFISNKLNGMIPPPFKYHITDQTVFFTNNDKSISIGC